MRPTCGSVMFVAAGLWLCSPMAASAQSLLAASGLGLLQEPLDARARALGSAGVGLTGFHLAGADPAASAGILFPTISIDYQSTRARLSDGARAARALFPNVGIAYPYGANTFSLQFTSFLDQDWRASTTEEVILSGAPITVNDQFASSGGIGQAHFGWARFFAESVAVGVTVGRYAGKVERSYVRILNQDDIGAGVEGFFSQSRWSASGVIVGAGVAWAPTPELRIGASGSWSGGLEMTASGGSASGSHTYGMPIEIRIGGAVSVVPGVSLVGSATYANWSRTDDDLVGGSARTAALSYGAGLETSGTEIFGRTVPFRVGVRHVDLPFYHEGSLSWEWVYAGGFGVNLVEEADVTLARLNVAIERGQRRAGSLSEDYWRTILSLQVAGN